ncbi:PGF-CTERM sorting domain-containing protein [Haloplanus natans]|uniref:PGF-CTERM sorting domain-containing protein n=1 Tax=Haloplanus natans TaxID=376171 RepID=UPI000677697B|nr:PGF-CTERM sorting domain-containing protein [Haloplanus natans]
MATRRTFLIGAAAATTGLAGAVGSASAQAQTFELELTEQGFVGRSPSGISGTTNPTLEMEAGNEYTISATFSYYPETEGLPARHNLALRTESGTPFRSNYVFPQDNDPESPSTSQSISTTVEATSNMTAYLCEEHMGEGGDISVSGGATATPEPTPTESDMDGGATATPTESGGGDGGGETSGGGPGFGVGAAVTALGAATYGALRKRDSDE